MTDQINMLRNLSIEIFLSFSALFLCACSQNIESPSSQLKDDDVGKTVILPSVSFKDKTLAECVAELNEKVAGLYKGEGEPPVIIIDTEPAEVSLEGISDRNLNAAAKLIKVNEYYADEWNENVSTNRLTFDARWISLYDVYRLLADINHAYTAYSDSKNFYIRSGSPQIFLREYRSKKMKWYVEDNPCPDTGDQHKCFVFFFENKPINRFAPETDSLLVLGTEAEHEDVLEYISDLKINIE